MSDQVVYRWDYCSCPSCVGKNGVGLPQDAIAGYPTPWAIICRRHGRIYLSNHEYNQQMDDAGNSWRCPVCLCQARFDDENLWAAEDQADAREENEPKNPLEIGAEKTPGF